MSVFEKFVTEDRIDSFVKDVKEVIEENFIVSSINFTFNDNVGYFSIYLFHVGLTSLSTKNFALDITFDKNGFVKTIASDDPTHHPIMLNNLVKILDKNIYKIDSYEALTANIVLVLSYIFLWIRNIYILLDSIPLCSYISYFHSFDEFREEFVYYKERGIYVIFNSMNMENPFIYIGKSENIAQRWQNHHRANELDLINKITPLTVVLMLESEDYGFKDLLATERKLINQLNPILNDTPVANLSIVAS